MIFSKVNKHIEDLSQDIRAYIDAKVDYFGLKFVKRISILLAKMAKGIVAFLILLSFLGMLSMAGAFFIGEALGSLGYGFLIVAGFYLIILICIMLVGKRYIQRIMIREVSREMIDIKEDLDQDHDYEE